MKPKHFIMTIAAAVLFAVGCNDKESVWSSAVDDMDVRLTNLEKLCAEANTNITALQTIINAQADGDVIKTVTEIKSDGKVVGYTITFGKNDPITIYNGKDGNDGEAPVIGVKKHTDNVYYWTLNGEWLLDNGEMLRVTGNSGADGVSPQLKIENGYWMISYDNGSTWTQAGKATGENGQNGDSMFLSVTQDENNVYFTLADGTVITISKNTTGTGDGGTGDGGTGENGNGDGGDSDENEDVYSDGVYNGYAYVDLGLPSGLKWATCNVGAANPWEYGDYFAWGETVGYGKSDPSNAHNQSYTGGSTVKTYYYWDTYKYCSGTSSNTLTKYNYSTSYGSVVDNKTTLDLSDDAARVNMGGSWRMPTTKEQRELFNNCYWEWTSSYSGKGVKGYIVYKVKSASDTGKKKYGGSSTITVGTYSLADPHIFFPAAGYRFKSGLYSDGNYGYYWSSSLHDHYNYNPSYAYYLDFLSVDVNWDYGGHRSNGCSVRAVVE